MIYEMQNQERLQIGLRNVGIGHLDPQLICVLFEIPASLNRLVEIVVEPCHVP
jgi:hypothetical protein